MQLFSIVCRTKEDCITAIPLSLIGFIRIRSFEHTNTTSATTTALAVSNVVFALENIPTTDGSEEHSTEILFTYTSRTAECSIMKFKDDNQFIEVAKFYFASTERMVRREESWMDAFVPSCLEFEAQIRHKQLSKQKLIQNVTLHLHFFKTNKLFSMYLFRRSFKSNA